MRTRREVLALAATLTATPRHVHAQQPGVVRRIGVLSPGSEADPVAQLWAKRLTEELRGLGWESGKNADIHLRWMDGSSESGNVAAKELVSARPDIVVVE